HLFASMSGIPESHATLARGVAHPQILIAAVLWIGLALALWSAGSRWLLAFVLVGGAALAPVLILSESANRYGYGFAAATSGICAAAWPRLRLGGRAVATILALLTVWHGMVVVGFVHRVGTIQARFSPALATAVEAASPGTQVKLRATEAAERWIF